MNVPPGYEPEDGPALDLLRDAVRDAVRDATEDEPDPNRTGMPKCLRCGDIAYRPDPIAGRKQAWRCGGCHRTLSRCSCPCDSLEGYWEKAYWRIVPKLQEALSERSDFDARLQTNVARLREWSATHGWSRGADVIEAILGEFEEVLSKPRSLLR